MYSSILYNARYHAQASADHWAQMPHFGATRHRSRPTGRARDALCSPWASSMVEGCVALAGFPMWWASGGTAVSRMPC
eukprot:scaffold7328_cov314-Pinguiococcus_pyrenoidosus.AAC.7